MSSRPSFVSVLAPALLLAVCGIACRAPNPAFRERQDAGAPQDLGPRRDSDGRPSEPSPDAPDSAGAQVDQSGGVAPDGPVTGSDGQADLAPEPESGSGLEGRYYNDVRFGDQKASQIDRVIDFLWDDAPASGMRPDGFTVRWTGFIEARCSGSHTFRSRVSDGLRLSIGGQTVIDGWRDRDPTELAGTAELQEGMRHPITIEFYDAGGGAEIDLRWQSACEAPATVPTSQLYPPAPVDCGALLPPGAGTGLSGEYFGDATLASRAATRTDGPISFDYGTERPHASVPAGDFSIRWTGRLQPRHKGLHTFDTRSDDGVRLFINDRIVLADWGKGGPKFNVGTVYLDPTQSYDVRLEYVNLGSLAEIHLGWASACIPREIIPQAQLFADRPVRPACPAARPAGGGKGLFAEYFTDGNFRNRLYTIGQEINEDWGIEAPFSGLPMDNFTARWTGTIEPRFVGPTTLHFTSDDQARIYVNGALVLDDWEAHAENERAVTLELSAARHTIRVDYRDVTHVAVARMHWSSPCQPRQIVPAVQLYEPNLP